MTTLGTKQIYVSQPQPAPLPTLPVNFVKPVSYEFRVAEHYDDGGKLTKVGLQVQIWEHDEYGVGIVKQPWEDVPRAKFDKNGAILIP
jgi:hypothetical protein